MKKGNKSTLSRILQYIAEYRWWIACLIVLASLSVVLTLYVPILVGEAIDCIVSKGNVDFERIIVLLIRTGIVSIITSLAQWLMNTISNKVTYQVVRDIRNEAFNKIEILPLKYIDSHSYGEIVSRVISDVDQFADGLLLGFSKLFTGVVTIIGTLFFMLMINAKIAVVVVVMTPLSLFAARFIATRTYSMFKLQSEVRGEQTAFVEEIIGGQKVVQAFNREEKSSQRFKEINKRLEKASLNATFYSSLTNPFTRFINNLVYAAVAFTGALAVINGSMTPGTLSSFLRYANQYTKPFNEISEVITELQNAIACAARIFELIDEQPQVSDKGNAALPETVTGNVTLKNVDFSYTSEQKLIEDFNLDVKSGMRVAIVGPTGCGKTTLINLLMRFYDVNSGSISVDGMDIRSVTRDSLRRNYGMVLQETWLKNGTVRENIAIGKPDASDDEIIAAAKLSHVHSIIMRMSDGYDTVITEDGGSLSQGEKQLLCIARVMLCLPPMLILDEATSSIDTRTEIKIQDAFAAMMKGRTSFIVAHRLSTIRNADVILVMKDGNIIERGNHADLLKQNGFYAMLYNSQFEQ